MAVGAMILTLMVLEMVILFLIITKCNNDGNHGTKVVVTINGIIRVFMLIMIINFVNSKCNNYRDIKKTYNHY